MGKEQSAYDNDLNDLYDLLNQFIEQETPLTDAEETLQALYPDNKHLAALLDGYVDGAAVFENLLENDDLKNILIYLCHVNPKVITMPLREDDDEDLHILSTVYAEKKQYKDIFNWIKKDHSNLIDDFKKREIQKKEQQVAILKEAAGYVQRGEIDQFEELLGRLSIDTIAEILTGEPKVFRKLLAYTFRDYLYVLLRVDISAVRISYGGTTLLNFVCYNSEKFQSVLGTIRDLYFEELTAIEKTQLIDALDESEDSLDELEEEKVEPGFSKPASFVQHHTNSKPSMLTIEQIEALSVVQPCPGFNPEMMPLIDTNYWPDNSILDAFLHQALRDKLAARGIALMPTIRRNESIEADLLTKMQNGEMFPYTTDVLIENQEITPVLEDKAIAAFQHVAWPVNVSNAHYGLFILSLTAVNGTPPRGFYLEPFNKQHMAQNILLSMSPAQRAMLPRPLLAGHIHLILKRFMYVNYVQRLTRRLPMREENFEYIFLEQSKDESYCSDYVIAVLSRLASEDIDLNRPESLFALRGTCLTDELVKSIRMLQLQRFGDGYLTLQLPAEPSPMALEEQMPESKEKLGVQNTKRKNGSEEHTSEGNRYVLFKKPKNEDGDSVESAAESMGHSAPDASSFESLAKPFQ
jgi:hypothetical protein